MDAKHAPMAQVAEDFVFFLRNREDGSRWPAGTKLYAESPLINAAQAMHGALIEAAQAARDAYEAALQDVPEGSCVPPWITRLEQAAERAHAALVMADERFKATGGAA